MSSSGRLFCHLAKLHIYIYIIGVLVQINKVLKNIKIVQRDKMKIFVVAVYTYTLCVAVTAVYAPYLRRDSNHCLECLLNRLHTKLYPSELKTQFVPRK